MFITDVMMLFMDQYAGSRMDPEQPGQVPHGRKRRVDILLVHSWEHVSLQVTQGLSVVMLGTEAGLQSSLNPLDACSHSVPGHLFVPAQVLQGKISHETTRFQVLLFLLSIQIPRMPAVALKKNMYFI